MIWCVGSCSYSPTCPNLLLMQCVHEYMLQLHTCHIHTLIYIHTYIWEHVLYSGTHMWIYMHSLLLHVLDWFTHCRFPQGILLVDPPHFLHMVSCHHTIKCHRVINISIDKERADFHLGCCQRSIAKHAKILSETVLQFSTLSFALSHTLSFSLQHGISSL